VNRNGLDVEQWCIARKVMNRLMAMTEDSFKVKAN
jgi:hypothetical protein